MRRFFAAPENFSEKEIQLNADESRHLRDVLRLRVGEPVAVFDGAGNEFLCSIERIERKAVSLLILEKINAPSPESDLNLTLAVALLKGEKFDLVVQKATELGVKRILPLETARADVKIRDEKDVAKKLERWRRIALEAAKQSGRAVVPEIENPIEFEDFVKTSSGERIFFAERGGEELNQMSNKDFEELTIVIGAEGGWDEREIELARAGDFKIVTLGGRILRAETAAIVTVALLQHLFGDLR
ncbi:MAG TPA: 16S rRNA (uracil(1498)-N(3))-methyltransferase [Pyrinomonadaceae bacterium]|nr:16S rRNA (uracil(1498)-N(3))-methyltransferase [Pyrinomonadaceae bacterium]